MPDRAVPQVRLRLEIKRDFLDLARLSKFARRSGAFFSPPQKSSAVLFAPPSWAGCCARQEVAPNPSGTKKSCAFIIVCLRAIVDLDAVLTRSSEGHHRMLDGCAVTAERRPNRPASQLYVETAALPILHSRLHLCERRAWANFDCHQSVWTRASAHKDSLPNP
jgi:hypothetical protein